MGWAFGVVEEKEVGYGVTAVCEHEGCHEDIDRGLGYACGGNIGSEDGACNGFFCGNHLWFGNERLLCAECFANEEREEEDDTNRSHD